MALRLYVQNKKNKKQTSLSCRCQEEALGYGPGYLGACVGGDVTDGQDSAHGRKLQVSHRAVLAFELIRCRNLLSGFGQIL